MNPPLEHDWLSTSGKHVDVLLHGQREASGKVYDVTADGQILWLEPEGVFTRWLVDKAEGYTVRLSCQRQS